MTMLFLVPLLFSLPFVWMLARRPLVRRLALRNSTRRPWESLFVVIGCVFGTAMITGALVFGDTFDASIRNAAPAQLGPVDEIVTATKPADQWALGKALTGFRDSSIDGVMFVSSTVLPTAGPDGAVLPQTQVIEADFRAAQRFGNDPSATGLSGPTPEVGHAVITQPVADRLGVRAGSSITVTRGPTVETLLVDRVLPPRGIAGLHEGLAGDTPNIFVAPGTMAPILRADRGAGIPTTLHALISNRGGVFDGVSKTPDAIRALQAPLSGIGLQVQPVKRELLDRADRAGASNRMFFATSGTFGVAAGVLLIVLVFIMLVEERRKELGAMRAVGLRRSGVVMALTTEGWIYTLAASVLGTLAGIGLARVGMAIATDAFASGTQPLTVALEFAVSRTSIALGLIVAFVLGLGTILAASVRVSFDNIVMQVRDEPSETGVLRRPRVRAIGVIAALGALAYGVTSVFTKDGSGVVVGVPIALAFSAPYLRSRIAWKHLGTVLAATALVWTLAAIPLAQLLDIPVNTTFLATNGLVATLAACVLIVLNLETIGSALGWTGGWTPALRVGLAYPVARRLRTGLTLGLFALTSYTLAFSVITVTLFTGNMAERERVYAGNMDLFVTTGQGHSTDALDLRSDPGVIDSVEFATVRAKIRATGVDQPIDWPVSGFTGSFLSRYAPKLLDRGKYKTDADAINAVLQDSSLVITGQNLLHETGATGQNNARIGDQIEIVNPATGERRVVTVAALTYYDAFQNGVMWSMPAVRSMFGPEVTPNRALLHVRGSDMNAFARAYERQHAALGVRADSTHELVVKLVDAQRQVLAILEAYLALGLVAGVAGLGVIMARAVNDRRHTIGMLRAVGFQARGVKRAFLIESAFIACQGVVVGCLLAVFSSKAAGQLMDTLTWSVPVPLLSFIAACTVLLAVLATLAPARRAARLHPSIALRGVN